LFSPYVHATNKKSLSAPITFVKVYMKYPVSINGNIGILVFGHIGCPKIFKVT
jgi:hypothetical protein